MTCKGLNCHVSIIEKRSLQGRTEIGKRKKKNQSAQNSSGLCYSGKEAEDRSAVQEASET